MYRGWTAARRSAVPLKRIKLPSDNVRADICLGLTVTGLYTLITMGLIIAFL
jgi:ABC-type thiamine transport system substrate-binding protein